MSAIGVEPRAVSAGNLLYTIHTSLASPHRGNYTTGHRIDGRGDASGGVQRIASRHFPYHRRQLKQVALVHRELVLRGVPKILGNMRGREKGAVANYLSGLNEPPAVPIRFA